MLVTKVKKDYCNTYPAEPRSRVAHLEEREVSPQHSVRLNGIFSVPGPSTVYDQVEKKKLSLVIEKRQRNIQTSELTSCKKVFNDSARASQRNIPIVQYNSCSVCSKGWYKLDVEIQNAACLPNKPTVWVSFIFKQHENIVRANILVQSR